MPQMHHKNTSLIVSTPRPQIQMLVQQGLALHQQGHLDQAKAIYEQILKIQPKNFDALQLLGTLSLQIKNYSKAIEFLTKAIQINSGHAPTYNNRGIAMMEIKRFDEALLSYKSAIKINPIYPEAFFNRGIALQELKRLDEALVCYNKAISFKPNYMEAYSNRGNVLKDLKRFNEAIKDYEKVLEIQPYFAQAYYNKGIALHGLHRFDEAVLSYSQAINILPTYEPAFRNRGVALQELERYEDALANYNQAIAVKPDEAEAYYNRGIVLYELKNLDGAVQSYEIAISINPNHADAYYNLGNTLRDMALLNDAKTSYKKALTIKPDFAMARWAEPYLSIWPLLPTVEDITKSRETFALELQELDEWFIGDRMQHAETMIGTSQPFYLAYQGQNNKELLSQYGKITNRLMLNWQQHHYPHPQETVKSNVIKIGIVSEQIRNHSVWNAITKGIVLNLAPALFEIHIFYLGNVSDEETKLAQATANTFTHNLSTLFEWTNAVLLKNLDVLIYPEIGMHPLTTKLANLRLAPMQMASWGHPETTGLPTIDYYLSAELFETDESQNAYSEKLIKLPNLGCHYSPLKVSGTDVNLQSLGLNPDSPILLCPGTLFKYAPQFDDLLVKLGKKIGKCQFVFFRQHPKWASILRARLEDSFKKAHLRADDYVVFIPWLNIADFYGLMQKADVFLDTAPFSGFNTAMQAIDCALPIVTKEGQFMRGRLASGILKRIALPELVTQTDDEYISLVARLVQEKNYCDQIRQQIIDSRNILYSDLQPIRTLEEFLINQLR